MSEGSLPASLEEASSSTEAAGQEPNSSGAPRLRAAAWVVAIAVALLLPIVVRSAWEGRRELALAEVAARDDDFDARIEHLGRAARWRMPLLSHDERALQRLMEIGAEAERGPAPRTQRALVAYREVRRALLGTRSLRVPHESMFHEANERIAVLMAAQEERFGTDVGGTSDPYTYHLGLLEEVPGPSPHRALLAALAFVGWVVSVVAFVWGAIDDDGRLRPRRAVRRGIVSLVLLTAWMVAVRYAGP